MTTNAKFQDDQSSFLRKIHWMMLLILFVMVAGFFTWSEQIGITRVLKVFTRIGMTAAIFLVYRMILKKGAVGTFEWKNGWSFKLYAGYLILGFVSFLWSTDIGYSALQWFMDLESLVFAYYFMKSLMVLETWFPDNKIRFYSLMGNTVFMLLLIFVVGMFVDPDTFFRLVEGGEDKRLGGYIMNPNELGMLCGLGISCLVFGLYEKQNRWLNVLKILVLTYALILTKSRSSLVGLLLIVFFHLRKSNSQWLKYSIYAGVVLAVPIAVENLIMRKGGIDDILSMTGRMPFWKALINEGLPREPLLGFGFMRIDYKDHFESVHTYAGHMTHNTFIQVLMNLGFIGLLLVLLQMFFTFRGFLREEEGKKLLLLGIIIPVIINSFTEFGIFGETNYGILFYQLLIFSISFNRPQRLTPSEKMFIRRKRPDLVRSADSRLN